MVQRKWKNPRLIDSGLNIKSALLFIQLELRAPYLS